MELPSRDLTGHSKIARRGSDLKSVPAPAPVFLEQVFPEPVLTAVAPRGRLIPSALSVPSSASPTTLLPSQQRTVPIMVAPALALLCAVLVAYCSTEVKLPSPNRALIVKTETMDRLAFQYALPAFRERVQQMVLPPQPVLAREEPVLKTVHTVSRVAPVTSEPRRPSSEQLVKKVLEVIRKYAPKRKDAAELAAAIVAESKTQQFDPLFVAAVIKSESTFNALARSNKGAEGLMQIMPRTGAWLADKQEIPRGHLTDPGYNLKLGVAYLKHLEEMYAGDRVFVLIAYNWGPGRVDSATDGKRRVPPEVVTYAVKIMNDYRKWQGSF